MLSVSAPQHVAASHILVLLADRDEDTRQMYGEYLTRAAVDIEEAADGRDALAKAIARPHDAIVTETRLPGISGYELCQLLRRDAATSATPIIVLTGDAYSADVEAARAAGADLVLVKPCLPDVLLAEMRRLIKRSSELRRRAQSLRARVSAQLLRSEALRARVAATARKPLSRSFGRHDTTTPPLPPPLLVCPQCDQPLAYERSHIGGVNERHAEQWDYYKCLKGCGTFQYRQRTKKLRHIA